MTEESFNPMVRKPMHPAVQLGALIGTLVLAIGIGLVFGGLFVAIRYGNSVVEDIQHLRLDSAQVKSALWTLQFLSMTLPILVIPLFFAYAIVRDPNDYLKYNTHFSPMLIILVILLAAVSAPIIELLGNINAKMVLPHSLKWLEDWMRHDEDAAQKMSNAMMQMPNFWSMFYDLMFIGLLTAIVEEVLFRGCFQTIFFRWTKNVHAAVWITAILFSAFHMEFYGFLPRVFLGVLFGYFCAWSGSIWPAILGHFANNGTIVVWSYLYQQKITSIDPNTPQLFNNIGYIISFILTLVLLLIYRYLSNQWQLAHHGEELD